MQRSLVAISPSRNVNLRETGPSRGETRWAGVLLHGRGKTPHEKIDLAARMHVPQFRWVVPEAPGGSWYPYRFMEPVERNQPWLDQALAACDDALVEASENGRLGPPQLAIVGFSQGACLTTEYVLRHPGRCGTAVIFTGGIAGPSTEHWRNGPRLDGLRVLITGSDVDDWVPEDRVRETADILTSLGADVRMRLYPGRGHVVSDEELVEARTLLQEIAQDADRHTEVRLKADPRSA
jgi:phospholipase/carboxylesterase